MDNSIMKNMKLLQKQKIKTLFLAMFALSFSVFGQETKQLISFNQAKQMVMENNPALLRQKEELRQVEFELKSKRGLYFPSISLNATALAMSDPLHLDLSPVGEAISPLYNTLGNYGVFSSVPNPNPATNGVMPTFPNEISTEIVREKLLAAGTEIENANWDKMIQEQNFALLSADFSWPIYTGGKIRSANKAAEIYGDISNEKLRNTEGTLLTELVTRYYGLVMAMQMVELRTEMLKNMENHYSDSQKLFENGMIARVELLHAEVSKNEAERELKVARRNVEILQTALQATLSNEQIQHPIPVSKLFINKELGDLEFVMNQASVLNPQLKQIQSNKDLVELKHKVEKGEFLPTIAAMGNYHLADKNYSMYAPDWFVGVGMQWTLFEGMSRKNNVRASKTLYNQVEFAEQEATNGLRAYLVKLFHELQMQMEQKEELETTLELANEYCISTEKAFNEGLATSTTLVEAHTKVLQVKTKRLKVFYDYDVTLAHFLQTAGVPEQFNQYVNGANTIAESL